MAAGERSVRVVPFVNNTMQPRLGDDVTQQIREQIQRDGTFRLSSRDDADIVVSGNMISYNRFELSFVREDVLTVRDFRVSMTARVTALERSTGKLLVDKDVSATTLVRVGWDLTSAERQALPLLATDLARNITALLADGEW